MYLGRADWGNGGKGKGKGEMHGLTNARVDIDQIFLSGSFV